MSGTSTTSVARHSVPYSSADAKLHLPIGRLLLVLMLATLAAASSGCSTFRGLQDSWRYNEGFNEFALGWRNYVWSRQAWHEHKEHFCDRAHADHFGRGFRQGFSDVANGATGCVPVMPPREYWSWQYQTAEGQAKVNAWFSGYPMGARAAEEYGAGNWYQIQTSGMYDAHWAGAAPMGAPAGDPVGPAVEAVPPGQPMIPPGGGYGASPESSPGSPVSYQYQ